MSKTTKKSIKTTSNNNSKDNTNNSNKENYIYRCHDWPDLIEEHNWVIAHNEFFSETKFINILQYNDIYKQDMESSLAFINNYEVPSNIEIKLENVPGCLICSHDYILPKVHYLLLKGYCDIKTIQYYLFSRGIFFKAWVLRKHIKHIFIIDKSDNDKGYNYLDLPKDKNLINEQILNIKKDIKRFEDLGGTANNNIILNLRNQLMQLLELKSNLDIDDKSESKRVSFDDIINEFKKHIPDLDNNNEDIENDTKTPKTIEESNENNRIQYKTNNDK